MKVLKDNREQLVEMFAREALTLEFLNHPGIPKVDLNGYFPFTPNKSTQELYCLVMEKIDGQNLEQWLAENGKISQSLALNWLRQLIEILDVVHQNKFLHRDIKPSNIMLKPDGQLVLIDFGTVRAIDNNYLADVEMNSVTTIFSEGYTPPEQINGQTIRQSDFYALGRTFLHFVTGKPPYEFHKISQLGKLVWQEEAPQISKPLADFIDDLMAFNPADRPQNTTVILRYLTAKNLLLKYAILLTNSRKFKWGLTVGIAIGISGIFLYRSAYPWISQNYYERGVEAQKVGQLDKAWEFYELALKYNPKDARIYNNMGLLCQTKKDFRCAQIKYEQALNLNPNNPVARYNLGGLYDDASDFQSAESQYKLAIESNSPVAVNALSDLARLKILDRDTTTAIELTTRGLQKVTNEQIKIKSTLSKNRGWAHLVQADYAEAKSDLQNAINFNPKRADSYCLLAQVIEAQGDKKGALTEWENCLEKDSRDSVEVKVWKTMASQRLKETGQNK
nr:protein kinase [Argonema antarcticum]